MKYYTSTTEFNCGIEPLAGDGSTASAPDAALLRGLSSLLSSVNFGGPPQGTLV